MEITLTFDTYFINLISCLHLPTFRSRAAMISEKSIVFTFVPPTQGGSA